MSNRSVKQTRQQLEEELAVLKKQRDAELAALKVKLEHQENRVSELSQSEDTLTSNLAMVKDERDEAKRKEQVAVTNLNELSMPEGIEQRLSDWSDHCAMLEMRIAQREEQGLDEAKLHIRNLLLMTPSPGRAAEITQEEAREFVGEDK